MSDTSTTAATLTIDPDPGIALTIRSVEMEEELGRPFVATLIVSAQGEDQKTPTTDLTAILGGSATVSVGGADGSTHYLNGIVARATYLGLVAGAFHYHVELRPWIWLLSHQSDCCIFQNMSAWTLITGIFRDAGFTAYEDKRQNQGGSTTLEYCVQYNETTFDFVTRLMEEWGLYYYVTHAEGAHTLVFADNPGSHTSIGTLSGALDGAVASDAVGRVWAVTADQTFTAGQHELGDYNFTTPAADLTARAIDAGTYGHGQLANYEYPGRYGVVADGTTLATVRMQQVAAPRKMLRGETDALAAGVGTTFTLSDFPDASANAEYLVTGTAWSLGATGTQAAGADFAGVYSATFTTIPATTSFSLDRRTPRPRIAGPQTARVVGQSGQEITTDQYGRIKVRFFWDRSTTTDENASCWIRVAQSWAGAAFGGLVTPRIGMEVLVDFLDGDPDQPIITGCVYNATNTVPYTLPDNATRSTFKTNSSIGGNGFNELRFEDKAGSEEVFLQAQKDLNVTVLNNRAVTTTQDDSLTVSKGKRTVTVSQGDEALTVSQGNRSVTVSQGNDSTTVSTGNRSATVSQGNDSITVSTGNLTISVNAGSVSITAGQSITLSVGANSIKIDTTGVTISAAQIELTADAKLAASAGGEMQLQGATVMIN